MEPRYLGCYGNLLLQVLNFLEQPRSRVGPHPLGAAFRQIQHLGGLGKRQAREEAQFDQFGGRGVVRSEFFQSFIDEQNVFVRGLRDGDHVVQVNALQAAAVSDGCLAPGAVHENVAHGFGGGGEEMPAVRPRMAAVAEQLEISLVDERGGLEGLIG